MKLSLAWICDHIAGLSLKDIDVETLIARFNVTTAEIDAVEKVTLDLDRFFLVLVRAHTDKHIVVYCDELQQELTMPFRDDAHVGNLFLVIKQGATFAWAKLTDWQNTKDGLLPAFACDQKLRAGAWKKELAPDDYIIEIGNTSITHRPDLWGHRGVAREVAAILDCKLVEIENLVSDIAVDAYASDAPATNQHPMAVTLAKTPACTRFALLHIPRISSVPSSLAMALRLARVDARPLNGIVDATNYVMFDLSHPIHAFDAEKIADGTIGPRMARAGEQLELLDGRTIALTAEDLVIADGVRPVALAGIMGGQATKVTAQTRSLVVEAAAFDASSIRHTATTHKLRTDGSTRFEKSLDPQQNIVALQRFVSLLLDQGIHFEVSQEIVSLGVVVHPGHISVSHKLIEEALGVSISAEFVVRTLTKLGMSVVQDAGHYGVTVPTYRSTKDIQIPEDIIEEVGRFYGYASIPRTLPRLPLKTHSLELIERRRSCAQTLVAGMGAREVYNYPLYDEAYLKQLDYEPAHAVALTNPVSENAYRLVTSLVPHLCKSVSLNASYQQPIRFFEWGRVWHKKQEKLVEQEKLAILMVDHGPVDFYDAKAYLQELFDAMHLAVVWRTASAVEPWCHPYKTAELVLDGVVIGYAGSMHPRYAAQLGFKEGFICQLASNALLATPNHVPVYAPASKYQGSWFDVSMLIARSVPIAQLEETVYHADGRIVRVTLKDFFYKAEWGDKHSVTLRFFIQPQDATLTKDELDAICALVQNNLIAQGATIR